MFYQGGLQSGISKAVKESKLVACFVTDNDEESQLWEDDFLQEPSLQRSFSSQTILLRLKANSEEAGYLAALFPLPKTPTLVIIQNGELKEYLTAGVPKEEFLRRIGIVFQAEQTVVSSQSPLVEALAPTASTPENAEMAGVIEGQRPLLSHPNPQPTTRQRTQSPAPDAMPNTASTSRAVQNLLEERSARLAAHKTEQDAREKAERAAAAKARREELQQHEAEGSKNSADMKYALMQKKRQQNAREERARILKRVEDDKVERRQKEEMRKANMARESSTDDSSTKSTFGSLQSPLTIRSSDCALQIRLFDGSTIRSRFSSNCNLRGDVRRWIDEQLNADIPYTFKIVLTPNPNKDISISDEELTLQSLGLTPSATLILISVKGYASAYEDSGVASIVSRGVSTGYGLAASGLGVVSGMLGSFFGAGPSPPQVRRDAAVPAPGITPAENVRMMRDQEDRPEDHQLYNGNALNFEPWKDDDGNKDE